MRRLTAACTGSVIRRMLLKLRGQFWLTDPVFAERASPFRHLGPKRFHAPPIALADLPPLRGVILSHDHYDHLDRETVLALAQTTGVFLTPLGVGDRLIEWGIDASKVRQFDWWQGAEIDGVRFTADARAAFFRPQPVRRQQHAYGRRG